MTRDTLLLPGLCVAIFASGCPDDDKPKAASKKEPSPARKEVDDPLLSPPDSAAAHRGDLDVVEARGELRVGVFGGTDSDFLARNGTPGSAERDLAARFADALGVRTHFVIFQSLEELLTGVEQGLCDVAASRITVTEERQAKLAFSAPVKVVSEVVIGRAGEGLPTTPAELGGRTVTVPPGSSYAATLRRLHDSEKAAGRSPVEIVEADSTLDDEQIAHLVAVGRASLAVIDSDLLETIQTYEPDVRALFPLREGRQIAWALRKTAKKLKTSADAFLTAYALTGHARQVTKVDLAAIKQRRVLRVLTRNNGVTYYLHRGTEVGFDYELTKLFAESLGVRLQVVVPPRGDLLIPWLLEGRGDVIAAAMTKTDARDQQVDFSVPYLFVDQMLVARRGDPNAPRTLRQLSGKRVVVRRSSSYFTTLEALQATHGPFEIVEADEELETEELLQQVAEGVIALTVADSHILDVDQAHPPAPGNAELEGVLSLTPVAAGAVDPSGRPLRHALPLAFAVRPDQPKLKATLDEWVSTHYRGLEHNLLKRKHFENERAKKERAAERRANPDRLSEYDDIIKQYAAQYGIDWRLMAAQAYQESRFDPAAKSWVGALGLFQVMPRTGAELGFKDLREPAVGTHAGIKYMRQMIEAFEPTLPFKERVRFALASYNAGRGHVLDARRLARSHGLNPDVWFGNVEKAMLLLEDDRYAQRARHGYCRGREPVAYVSQIQTRYDAYAKLLPER